MRFHSSTGCPAKRVVDDNPRRVTIRHIWSGTIFWCMWLETRWWITHMELTFSVGYAISGTCTTALLWAGCVCTVQMSSEFRSSLQLYWLPFRLPSTDKRTPWWACRTISIWVEMAPVIDNDFGCSIPEGWMLKVQKVRVAQKSIISQSYALHPSISVHGPIIVLL